MNLPPLQLPPYACKISKSDEGKLLIFDPVRRKNVVLTPEEWVRQHFIHLLTSFYNIPRGLIRIESGLTYNKMQRRTDIVVYNNEGSPYLLVECKAPGVPINQKTLEQASVYNKIISAEYLAVTNGMKTYIFKLNFETGEVVPIDDIPVM